MPYQSQNLFLLYERKIRRRRMESKPDSGIARYLKISRIEVILFQVILTVEGKIFRMIERILKPFTGKRGLVEYSSAIQSWHETWR
jgi:hypothetical protein